MHAMREVKRKFLSAMVKKVIQITPEAIATSDLSKYVNQYIPLSRMPPWVGFFKTTTYSTNGQWHYHIFLLLMYETMLIFYSHGPNFKTAKEVLWLLFYRWRRPKRCCQKPTLKHKGGFSPCNMWLGKASRALRGDCIRTEVAQTWA